MPTGRDLHHDTPLTNLAIAAFETMGDFVAPRVFPIVRVDKQSDRYYTIDSATWLRMPETRRAPKTKANMIEFRVSSDSFFCDNYALATDNPLEDLDNADRAIQLRESSTLLVTRGLLADMELRVATTAQSFAATMVRQTGANAWDAVTSADIMTQVLTGHLEIFQKTGLRANTLVLDYQSYMYARRNERAFERFKYVEGGLLSDTQLRELFMVDQILVARSLRNQAYEGQAASLMSIWGPTALLCRIEPNPGLKAATFGLSFRWQPEGFPAPMSVSRKVYSGAGDINAEVIEASYYQDEKVVAPSLGYYINTKSGFVW